MKPFTPEELEELERFDAELDEEFTFTQEDLDRSRRLDRQAKLDRLDNRSRKIADYQAAYREANREAYNAYMRAYQRARREKKKAASDAANIGNGTGK